MAGVPDGAGPDGRHGPHVFVTDLEQPQLAPEDRHHLARALRLRDGEPLTLSDGRGRWRPAAFGDPVEPTGPVVEVAGLAPRLTVAFALVKGQRPEWAVQRLTEAGIDVIRPFVAARSVVRWNDTRTDGHLERLRRVAREAAMQSRRCHLPDITAPADFATVTAGEGVGLAEPGGAAPTLALPTVVVGPEGGWAPEERERGLPTVALGAGVYRAETAAVAAGVLLTALRAGIITHSDSTAW